MRVPTRLARALASSGSAAAARGLSGPAFRDMTWVARGDPRVAEAYCRNNAAEVRAAWERFRAEVDALLLGLAAPSARTES